MAERKINIDSLKMADYDGKTMDHLFPMALSQKSKDPFDTPFPPDTDVDMAHNHAQQEWVFNHLPLTETQKLWLADELLKEQGKPSMVQPSKAVKLRRVYTRKTDEVTGERSSVKETTKRA